MVTLMFTLMVILVMLVAMLVVEVVMLQVVVVVCPTQSPGATWLTWQVTIRGSAVVATTAETVAEILVTETKEDLIIIAPMIETEETETEETESIASSNSSMVISSSQGGGIVKKMTETETVTLPQAWPRTAEIAVTLLPTETGLIAGGARMLAPPLAWPHPLTLTITPLQDMSVKEREAPLVVAAWW
jgi:hypothetical protein